MNDFRSPVDITVNSRAGNLHVTAVDYHRNGVSGAPFYCVLFEWQDDTSRKPHTRKMLGVLHTYTDEPYPTYCAVFDVDLLSEGCIEFSVNSWHGEHFKGGLTEAVRLWRESENAKIEQPIEMDVAK